MSRIQGIQTIKVDRTIDVEIVTCDGCSREQIQKSDYDKIASDVNPWYELRGPEVSNRAYNMYGQSYYDFCSLECIIKWANIANSEKVSR